MRRKTLGFDIDGVIADYFSPFLAHINQHLGTEHQYDDCVSHNLADAIGVPVNQMHQLLSVYETAEVISSLPPLEGAVAGLRLLDTRYEIAIITSRKTTWEKATHTWFTQHFPEASIYYAMGRNNQFAGGDNRLHKPQVAEQLGAICLVEDNEQEFLHWDSSAVEPICFAQPWNRSLAITHPHIPRLDWAGIIERYMS